MDWAQFSSNHGHGVSTHNINTLKAFKNTNFMSGLSRDRFLGTQRCVVCGHTPTHPTPIVVEQDRNFHGKGIALDVNDPLAPFPSLLLDHENCARAHFLFAPDTHDLSPTAAWQDWIDTEGLFDDQTRTFYRDAREKYDSPTTLRGTPLPSGTCQLSVSLRLNDYTSEETVTKEIVYETRAMRSWKACRREWKKRRMTGVDLEPSDSSDSEE
ncbi:hypothetical protein H0H93_000758 [Arthromyces matolae]|nr:hypothetical protein H0H93_000758 [Arthromyces matolae]